IKSDNETAEFNALYQELSQSNEAHTSATFNREVNKGMAAADNRCPAEFAELAAVAEHESPATSISAPAKPVRVQAPIEEAAQQQSRPRQREAAAPIAEQ